jgi:hypothetical protein
MHWAWAGTEGEDFLDMIEFIVGVGTFELPYF